MAPTIRPVGYGDGNGYGYGYGNGYGNGYGTASPHRLRRQAPAP